MTSANDSASKNVFDKLYNNIILKESSNALRHSSLFSIEVIDKCVKSLKLGKAQGPDSLSAEHLLHWHPIIYLHRCNLFSSLVIHGFVPDDFCSGVEVCRLNTKDIKSLEYPITCALFKIFKTSSNEIIDEYKRSFRR